MEMTERITAEGRQVLQALKSQGVSFEITDKNKLRIRTRTTKEQFEIIRRWKAQIINELSPKCSNCTLAMELINDGTFWFCPFGCESRKNVSRGEEK